VDDLRRRQRLPRPHAAAKDGYLWRTAATLAEPGVEADAWIGNACATGDGRSVVVT
jgi:hypothetical protein